MLDINLLGNRIKELRKQRGLTQNAFAEALHVSFQAVSNWERGIAPPDIENLMQIASYFGVLIDTLLSPIGEDLYLGIDGGGTKTEFAVVSSSGHVFKRVVKSGSNPNDIGFSKTEELIITGVNDILVQYPSVKGIFCGIAGMTTGNYAEKLYTSLKKRCPNIELRVNSDAFNLFFLHDGADMALISGTGSVLFVRDGESYKRLGGWGHLFDRAGSAYDIGRDVICHALGEEDSLKSPSLIRNLLCKKMNVSTVWEHINTLYNKGKPYIASFSSVAFEAYRMNDEKAIQIIDNNGKALAELLNRAVAIYGKRAVAVASGGLFEHYSDIMREHISKYSSVELMISKLPPIYGACRRACAIAGGEMSEHFYENFENTYREIKK